MKKLSALLVAGVMAASLAAYADDDAGLTSSTTSEKGPMYTDNPTLQSIVTLPFRAVTGPAGFAIGFTGGAMKGVVTGVQDGFKFAEDAGLHDHERTDLVSSFAKGLFYFPVAALGTALYVPKNVLVGSFENGWEYGSKSCAWWDRF